MSTSCGTPSSSIHGVDNLQLFEALAADNLQLELLSRSRSSMPLELETTDLLLWNCKGSILEEDIFFGYELGNTTPNGNGAPNTRIRNKGFRSFFVSERHFHAPNTALVISLFGCK